MTREMYFSVKANGIAVISQLCKLLNISLPYVSLKWILVFIYYSLHKELKNNPTIYYYILPITIGILKLEEINIDLFIRYIFGALID